MSADSNVVCVPYMGTTWMCRVSRLRIIAPHDQIVDISIGGHWLDAAVVLDSLFLNRMEAAMQAMPSNTEPNLSWPRSIA